MIRKLSLVLAAYVLTAIVAETLFSRTGFPTGLLTIGFHLILGGFKHAMVSVPFAFGSASQVLWTLGTLLGIVLALHGLMIWLARKQGRWTPSQSLRILALGLLVAGGGSAVIHAAQNAIRLVTHDSFSTPDRGYQDRSISNARQLITAMRIYASEHGGSYPEHLEELIAADILEPEDLARLNRASYPGEAPAPWIYLKGLREDSPHDLPLLVSPTPYGRRSYTIGYNDSRVSWVKATEYEAALQRWRDFRKLSSVKKEGAP